MCAEKVFFILRKDYLRLLKLTTKVVKALTISRYRRIYSSKYIYLFTLVFPILFPHLALT